MIPAWSEWTPSLLHLFFPRLCAGCGAECPDRIATICLRCLLALPVTHFESLPGNPVEKAFYGRISLAAASAGFYFSKGSMMQRILHELKYQHRPELGIQLGKLLGDRLQASQRFKPDLLIPLPLHVRKERQRGYNQATLLCQGIAKALQVPMRTDIVSRPRFTATQTRKDRIERWANMDGRFLLEQPEAVRGKTLLLVDDLITTGATLEACGRALLTAPDVTLSIATLCYAAS